MDTIGETISEESLGKLKEKQLRVIIGGGKGDEAKGTEGIQMSLHTDVEIAIGSAGGKNAGHNGELDDGRVFVGHNMPASSMVAPEVFLGQAKTIDPFSLEKEIDALTNIGSTPTIKVAYGAHIGLATVHEHMDAAFEGFKSGKGTDIGTTKSGIGPAAGTRALRNGIQIGALIEMSDEQISQATEEFLEPFADHMTASPADVEQNLIDCRQKLYAMVAGGKIEMVDDMYARDMYNEGKTMLIEGAQSPGLGMYSGAYPCNTSNDTSFLGNLSPLGIVPVTERVGQLLVVKLFPSAVGNHEFPERFSHVSTGLLSKEEEFAAATGEFGATTERLRMVGFPSPALLAEQVANDPFVDVVSIRKLDVVGKYLQIMNHSSIPTVVEYDEGRPVIEDTQPNSNAIVTRYRDALTTIAGEDKGGLPIILGYGKQPRDSRIHRLS